VEYEVLPYVLDAEAALEPDAAPVYAGGNLAGETIWAKRGDVDAGMAEADEVFREVYRTQHTSGAPMEPRVALAAWEGERVTVWKSGRAVYADQRTLAGMLEVPLEAVRVITPTMGGSYGNKDESRLSAIVAQLARRAGRPVRGQYTREEEFLFGRLRHPAVVELEIGIARDGSITAVRDRTTMNTGAYVPGVNVVRRSGQAAIYLYRCANVSFEGRVAWTNSYVAGSFRGLGAPQGQFALEGMIDTIAETIGVDPLAYRLQQVVGPEGQPGKRESAPTELVPPQPIEGGIPFSSYGLRQCLEEGATKFGWEPRVGRSNPDQVGPVKRGSGMAASIYQTGQQPTEGSVEIGADGRALLLLGTVDVGQGSNGVMKQIAAETLGIPVERVDARFADTGETPYSHTTAGSATTFSSGLATQAATNDAIAQLLELAAPLLEAPVEDLEWTGDGVRRKGRGRAATVTVAELFEQTETDVVTGRARPQIGSTTHIVNSFAAHFAEVDVDTETGEVHVRGRFAGAWCKESATHCRRRCRSIPTDDRTRATSTACGCRG
jgi:xanthine dehydrogenase molybdenum-binding subunit